MKKHFVFVFSLFFFSLITSKYLFAQVAYSDSSSQQIAFNKAVGTFYASEGNQSPLYNGKEYFDYLPTIKGNAYFLDSKSFSKGNIYFDGIWYNDVQMLYDLNKDEVVVLLFNNFTKITLVKQKVISFDYLGFHFKNINSDTIKNKNNLKSGFYGEPYNGKTEVLVKWGKNFQTISGGLIAPESYFNSFKDYYIKKGKDYYHISSKSALLELFKDKKEEIKQFIHSSNLKFRESPENFMAVVATYYDKITN
jgi:hypothetical protein